MRNVDELSGTPYIPDSEATDALNEARVGTHAGEIQEQVARHYGDVNWSDQVIESADRSRLFLMTPLRSRRGERKNSMDAYVVREPIDRELRRRQLAQRLVTHHARTRTIFRLTGLSRHQLATLRQRWRLPNEIRHRGPPPNSFAVLLSTHRIRIEAAALAVYWRILGSVGSGIPSSQQQGMVELGECLCEVFEAYVACFRKSDIELEHVALLARGIEEADAIALAKCANCEAVILVDLLATRRRLCGHCQRSGAASATNSDSSIEGDSLKPLGTGEAVQQELF